MESVRLPYELLAEIFKIYVDQADPSPEILLQVCRSWSAVASHESTLWTKFVVSSEMIRWEEEDYDREDATLTRDWAGIFKRRLARAGPSLPLQISILDLHTLSLPAIDVISGGAPEYDLLPRWETLIFRTGTLIRPYDGWQVWGGIANLISQPMPSLKLLTLQQNKIDFHAFPNAPNLEELNVLSSRSPRLGRKNSFPNLKKVHITYPSKYPLSLVRLDKFSLRTIETLTIGGEIEIGDRLRGTYPSLSTLEFTDRVPGGVVRMLTPRLRCLTLRNANLFPITYPDGGSQHDNPRPKNRLTLEMLGLTFPTVEVLEVHENLQDLVLEVWGETVFFKGLKEFWALSKDDRKGIDLY